MWFSYGALLLVTSAVVLLLLTWLWNTTLPDIFDLPQVRMWQMLRLLLILALLVLVALVAAWMWAQAIGLAL